MKHIRLIGMILVLLGIWASNAVAQDEAPDTTFLPIGGFYGDTFPGFIETALPHAGEDRVYILVVPASFAYDAEVMTSEELLINTIDAERRRRQLEDVCNEMSELPCVVIVIPAYTKELAQQEIVLDFFPEDLAGVYFLGGDQTIAMQIIAGSILEGALEEAFLRGVPMGGNSAGLAVLSYNMIAGYSADEFGPENGLNEGSVLIWNTEAERGLSFGSQNVVLEQHFWERARLSRALNALTLPDTPNILIGVDSFTGGKLVNDTTFGDIFGVYTAAVFDADTFGAAENATFGAQSGTLSMRDVVFHLLAEGDFSYDILNRSMNIAPLIEAGGVDYSGLNVSADSADIIIGGNLFGVFEGEEADIFGQFIASAGGDSATIHIIATGYADESSAQAGVDMYREALLALAPNLQISESIVLDAPLAADEIPNGALIIGADQSLLNADNVRVVLDWYLAGTTLFFDGAASPLAGVYISAHAPTPYDSDDDLLIEEATQASFLEGSTTVTNGLGLLNANFEPRLMDDNRFGRWVSLAYYLPEITTFGIADDTALFLSGDGSTVLGLNGVFALDLRHATLDTGTNGGKVFANGLLDILTAGDAIDTSGILELITPDDYQLNFIEPATPHILIDVRTPEEFASGHIAGAINISVDTIADNISQIPTDMPLVVYCRSGNRSAVAASILSEAGYSPIYDLGGIIAWQDAGYPIQ